MNKINWQILSSKNIFKSHPFTVEEVEQKFDEKTLPPYYRLRALDWVNVLPILPDGTVVLIKQPRIGSESFVLETPGGVMAEGERDTTMTAARELEEETGLTSRRILPLASINPNPAIMTNRCHFFVALHCQPASPRKFFPDADERIELVPTAPQDLDQLVRTGQINHALSALCILLAAKYVPAIKGDATCSQ